MGAKECAAHVLNKVVEFLKDDYLKVSPVIVALFALTTGVCIH